jgi:hypothetical protein
MINVGRGSQSEPLSCIMLKNKRAHTIHSHECTQAGRVRTFFDHGSRKEWITHTCNHWLNCRAVFRTCGEYYDAKASKSTRKSTCKKIEKTLPHVK